MKNLLVGVFSLILVCFSVQVANGQRFWIATTTGNWGDPNNWSLTATGPGGAGVPGAGDLVSFTASRLGSCNVNVNPNSVAGVSIAAGYAGTINLSTFTLTTTGTNTFAGGTMNATTGSLVINNAALNTTFSGTTFGAPITGTTGRLFFNGGTFNGAVTLTKTSNNDDDSNGNCTFAAAVSLSNNSANRVRMAATTRDIFNSTVTLNLLSTGAFELAHGSAVATQFNDNIIINYINNAPARIGNGTGISTLASGKTITVNPGASGAGNMTLGGLTMVSPQNIALTGNNSATMSIRTNTTFNGAAQLKAAAFQLATGVWNSTLTIEKTGTSADNITGGNTYTGFVNIINSGDGEFNFAATNPDTFNGGLQLDNTGAGRIQIGLDAVGTVINGGLTVNHGGNTAGINCIFARNSAATVTINGDVTLNETNVSTGSGIIMGNDGKVTINGNISLNSSAGRGILFGNGAGSATIGNGFAITSTAASFTAGSLYMNRTTQLGTATQNIELGGSAQLRIETANIFNGPVNFRAPSVYLGPSTYNNSAVIENYGAPTSDSPGGCTFAGPTTFKLSGSGHFTTDGNNTFNGQTTVQNTGSNYISLEHVAGSTYNGPVEFNNSGSSNIRVARTGNTVFNDNIVVNSTAVGGQILFCETTASTTATLVTGKTISTTGFSNGELTLSRFIQQGPTAQTLNFVFPGTGVLRIGPSTSFDGNVTFSAPRMLLHGATYNGTASITKTGPTNDNGQGGNIFNAATTLANSGSAYLLTASTNPDIFNGVLTINNTGSSTIRLADGVTGNQFNNNIILNTSSGSGIYFGNSAGSGSTLANDRTISAGSVLSGDIRLMRIVQNSSVVPQVLDLDGIATLTIGPSSKFGGDVDFRAPQLYLNGCTYGTNPATNTARLEKEGATDNIGDGGNIFNAVTTLINSGSAPLRTADNFPDTFNGNLTANNTSSSQISLSYTVAGTQYNGNITVSNVLGGTGIYFGLNGGTSTLTPTGVLAIGPAGFVSGDLRFMRFTQGGSLTQTLLLTPPAAGTARLRLGPASSFGGPVDFRSPRVLLEGVTFNDVTYIEKTGATDDASNGGNVFNGVTTLANSGSGWFINANAALDQFNNDLTLTNSGSAGIRMADNIPGTIFRGNIAINNTFGSGIYFCENNGAATAEIVAGKVITVGAFTTGDLRFRRFTQTGTTAQVFTLTGSSRLILGPTNNWGGDVNYKAPQLFINTGSVYNGAATLEKSGATDNTGTGGSLFRGTTIIRNSGSGFLRTNGGNTFNGTTTLIVTGGSDMRLEDASGGTYNGDLEVINTGTSIVRVGAVGTTALNGNVLVNSTNGTGVYFGEAATAVNLADGKSIGVGANGGFTAGDLRFNKFNQLGTTAPSNLVMTGASQLIFQGGSTFNAALTTSSPRVFFQGASFFGTSSFTKTNASNDDSNGGNTFAGATTFTTAGAGRIRLANTTADAYTGNMTFVKVGGGTLEPAYNGTNTFSGDVTVNSAVAIIFGGGTGTQTFTGSNTQTISKLGTATAQINRLIVNKAANGITLNTDIIIGNSATFTNGIITSTTTNSPLFNNGATVSGASNASHVSGPVRKTGTDAFTFPVGKNGIYKSIAVGTRTVGSDVYTAEYFNAAQAISNVYGTGINRISGCEYWNLARTGTSTPTVTLSWKNSDCSGTYVSNTTDLRVSSYNTGTARWEDRGNGGVTGVGGGLPGEGTIVSSAGVNVFGAFALATATASNALPIVLVDFTAVNMGAFVALNWKTGSEHNNDYFTVQRSTDGFEFSEIGTIKGNGTSNKEISYTFNDATPLGGVSYYRLKQTDFDKNSTFSKIVKVNRDEEPMLMVYPNPISVGDGVKAYTNIRGSFSVYNSVGTIVLSKENSNEFDISQLSPGVYIVRSSSGQATRLLVK